MARFSKHFYRSVIRLIKLVIAFIIVIQPFQPKIKEHSANHKQDENLHRIKDDFQSRFQNHPLPFYRQVFYYFKICQNENGLYMGNDEKTSPNTGKGYDLLIFRFIFALAAMTDAVKGQTMVFYFKMPIAFHNFFDITE